MQIRGAEETDEPVTQVLALLSLENGLFLAAIALTYGMPLVIELGVFFDLLVGSLLMAVFVGRISDSFETINVDRLRSLRG